MRDDVDYLPMAKPKALNSFGETRRVRNQNWMPGRSSLLIGKRSEVPFEGSEN